MTVDTAGRVHVLVRGEDGSPAHFQRDPTTEKWTRQSIASRGMLLPGSMEQVFIVSDSGLQRMSVGKSGTMEQVAVGQPNLFENSKMAVDPTRTAHDGRVSVIGQRGKTVTVVDYFVGPRSKKIQ